MDDRTRKELMKITMGVPSRLGAKLMHKEVNVETENLAKEYIKQYGSSMPAKMKRDIELLIEAGAFRTSTDIVDENVTKELDRYYEAKIDKARKQGKLPDPAKDKWVKNHLARLRK